MDLLIPARFGYAARRRLESRDPYGPPAAAGGWRAPSPVATGEGEDGGQAGDVDCGFRRNDGFRANDGRRLTDG